MSYRIKIQSRHLISALARQKKKSCNSIHALFVKHVGGKKSYEQFYRCHCVGVFYVTRKLMQKEHMPLALYTHTHTLLTGKPVKITHEKL